MPGREGVLPEPLRRALVLQVWGAARRDNVVARCKAYLDGAASALGINDRVLRLRGVERIKDMQRWKDMEVVFWREDGEDCCGGATPGARCLTPGNEPRDGEEAGV